MSGPPPAPISSDPSPPDNPSSAKSGTGVGGTTAGTERSKSDKNRSGSRSSSRSGKDEGGKGEGEGEKYSYRYHAKLVRKMASDKYAKKGSYFPFTYDDVIRTLRQVKLIFEAEPPMIEIKVPVVIVGDVHGQFFDVCRIFEMFASSDGVPGYMTTRYAFLGDYVDRGRQSLEIVMMLFNLKILYPTQFALIRGNHECRAINRAYGFFAEIKERFVDQKRTMIIFENFNIIFSHMPLACLIADSVLCMHGGVSTKMKTRDDILKIPKPIKDVATNQIATDLLWADPMIGLDSEIPNKVRGVSVYFGEETLDQVLINLKIKFVIRGHQMMMNGFNFFHSKLITVFSAAAYYPDKPNRGAICVIDREGRLGFRALIPLPPDDPNFQPKVFRGDPDVANDYDTGYVKVAPHIAAAIAAKQAQKKLKEEGSGGGETTPAGNKEQKI